MIFRRVRVEEARAYHELVQAGYGSDAESSALFEAARNGFEEALARLEAHPTWGFDVDGRLVAACSVRLPWSVKPGPWVLPHLGWLTTHPDVRGRGLGSSLTDEVLAVLRDDFLAPAVTLGTAVEHSLLPGYYERHGWLPVEDRDLGLGHVTRFYIRILHDEDFARRRETLGIPVPSVASKGAS